MNESKEKANNVSYRPKFDVKAYTISNNAYYSLLHYTLNGMENKVCTRLEEH